MKRISSSATLNLKGCKDKQAWSGPINSIYLYMGVSKISGALLGAPIVRTIVFLGSILVST